MSKKAFEPYDCIAALNTVKNGLQMTERPFTKEKLLVGLKGCGLPTNNIFWSAFRNSEILQEVSRGQFMFKSKSPIYVGELVKIRHRYLNVLHKYKENSVKSESKEEEHKEEVNESIPVTDKNALTKFAIDFLKEQGYLVYAPV